MQTEIDALLERVRAYRHHRQWSINRLAKEAEVPWSVLQGMDEPSWSPSLKTLRSLLAKVPAEFEASAPAPRPKRPRPPTTTEGRAA